MLTQRLGQLITIHERHVHIGNHQIKIQRIPQFKGLFAIVGGGDFGPQRLQLFAKNGLVDGVVFCHQNAQADTYRGQCVFKPFSGSGPLKNQGKAATDCPNVIAVDLQDLGTVAVFIRRSPADDHPLTVRHGARCLGCDLQKGEGRVVHGFLCGGQGVGSPAIEPVDQALLQLLERRQHANRHALDVDIAAVRQLSRDDR